MCLHHRVLFDMTRELKGETVGNLWRRTLTEMQRRLAKRLRSAALQRPQQQHIPPLPNA